jgi:hypothetical protein
MATALLGGELAGAMATHSLGKAALGPPGSGGIGPVQTAGHLVSSLSAYSTGARGGQVSQQHPNQEKSHPNVTHQGSDGPVMAYRVLTGPATHMIPDQDDILFLHKPRKGEAMSPGLSALNDALNPRTAAYATGHALSDTNDLRALVGLNIWALNQLAADEQIRLWLTNPALASTIGPRDIWHGHPDLPWTGFTCDGCVRLGELLGSAQVLPPLLSIVSGHFRYAQGASIFNDGYAVFTPYKKTAKTPQASSPQKAAAVVRAGMVRTRDIWKSRGTKAGASLHLIFTATPLRDKQEQLKYVTSAKSETAEFANVTNVVKIPTLADFHDAAKKFAGKDNRQAEMLRNMKKVPPIYQLIPWVNENGGGDVPLKFLTYTDAWEMQRFDGLPMFVGKILHPAFASCPQPPIESPDDEDFVAATNGFDAMSRQLITNVVFQPEKDGHMTYG